MADPNNIGPPPPSGFGGSIDPASPTGPTDSAGPAGPAVDPVAAGEEARAAALRLASLAQGAADALRRLTRDDIPLAFANSAKPLRELVESIVPSGIDRRPKLVRAIVSEIGKEGKQWRRIAKVIPVTIKHVLQIYFGQPGFRKKLAGGLRDALAFSQPDEVRAHNLDIIVGHLFVAFRGLAPEAVKAKLTDRDALVLQLSTEIYSKAAPALRTSESLVDSRQTTDDSHGSEGTGVLESEGTVVLGSGGLGVLGSGVQGTGLRVQGRTSTVEGGDSSSVIAAVDFADVYNALLALEANRGKNARRAFLSDEQMSALSDAVDDETVEALVAVPEMRTALLRSLDHPSVRESLGDDRCAVYRAVLEQSAGPGSLDPHSPYRYLPGTDRHPDDSPDEVEKVAARWREAFDEEKLRAETERTRALGPRGRMKEGIARLGLGERGDLFTCSFPCDTSGLHRIVERVLKDHGVAQNGFLDIGVYGAGLVDLSNPEASFYPMTLRPLVQARGLKVPALSFHPFQWLTMHSEGRKSVNVEVFDVSKRVYEILTDSSLDFVWPLYDENGEPFERGERMSMAERVARELGAGDGDRVKLIHGIEAYVFKLPEEVRERIKAHRVDLGTDLLPDGPRHHLSVYLRTAYLMDPRLQRVAFLKIVDRTVEGGLILSDYLLTDVEASLLGLKRGVKIEASTRGTDSEGRDSYFFLYRKIPDSEASPPNRFVSEMMEVIRRVQGDPAMPPAVFDEGEEKRDENLVARQNFELLVAATFFYLRGKIPFDDDETGRIEDAFRDNKIQELLEDETIRTKFLAVLDDPQIQAALGEEVCDEFKLLIRASAPEGHEGMKTTWDGTVAMVTRSTSDVGAAPPIRQEDVFPFRFAFRNGEGEHFPIHPADPEPVGLDDYRRNEINRVLDALKAGARVVAVTGQPGTGKTKFVGNALKVLLNAEGSKFQLVTLEPRAEDDLLPPGSATPVLVFDEANNPIYRQHHLEILTKVWGAGGRIVFLGGAGRTPQDQIVGLTAYARWRFSAEPEKIVEVRLLVKPLNRKQAEQMLFAKNGSLSGEERKIYADFVLERIPALTRALSFFALSDGVKSLAAAFDHFRTRFNERFFGTDRDNLFIVPIDPGALIGVSERLQSDFETALAKARAANAPSAPSLLNPDGLLLPDETPSVDIPSDLFEQFRDLLPERPRDHADYPQARSELIRMAGGHPVSRERWIEIMVDWLKKNETSPSSWEAHRNNNKNNIREAARLVRHDGRGNSDPKKRPVVRVLGAGNGLSIPLEELASEFRVVLVDMNEVSLHLALRLVPEHLKPYVTAEVRDLSDGLNARLVRDLKQILNRNSEAEAALAEAARLLNETVLPPSDLTGGETADLLISDMLVTQVASYPVVQFTPAMAGKFATSPQDNPAFLKAVAKFFGRVIGAHANALASHAEQKKGVVYFSSDVWWSTPVGMAPSVFSGEGEVYTRLSDLFKGLPRGMIQRSTEWTWNYHRREKEYHVHGLILAHPEYLRPAATPTAPPSRDLHPSVKGGEYDPERIRSGDVEGLERKLRFQLKTENIVRVAGARAGKSRDDLLFETRYAEGHLMASGGDTDLVRGTMGYTFFARRHAEFEYLQTAVIPELEKGHDEIVIGDFGPGFERRPVRIDGTGRSYFTFEPYLLAGLSKKARVIPYDLAPEAVEAMRTYDGNMALTEMWRYPKLDWSTPGLVEQLERDYGVNWEEKARRHGEFFEGFVLKHGGNIRSRKWVPTDQFPVPIVFVQFPKDAFAGVEVPAGTVDIAVDPLDDRPMDIAYFHLHGYLDWGSGNSLLSLMTLVRIVHRLKPGGYLITEPPSYRFDGVMPPHIPNPVLMRVLGLVPVIDMSAEEHGGTPAMFFRKEGGSNEFVRTMAEQIEAALEIVRSRPREADRPRRDRAGVRRRGRERSDNGGDAAVVARTLGFERQYLAQRGSKTAIIDNSALAVPTEHLIDILYRNPPARPMTIRGTNGVVRVSMKPQGGDLVVTVHVRPGESAEAIARKIDRQVRRQAWSAPDSSRRLTLVQCLIKPESIGHGSGMKLAGLRGTGSHRVDLGDDWLLLIEEKPRNATEGWYYSLSIKTGEMSARPVFFAGEVGKIRRDQEGGFTHIFTVPVFPGEIKIRLEAEHPESFVAEYWDGYSRKEVVENVQFLNIKEPTGKKREIVFSLKEGGEIRRTVEFTGKDSHSDPEAKNPDAATGSFADAQDDGRVATGEHVVIKAMAAGDVDREIVTGLDEAEMQESFREDLAQGELKILESVDDIVEGGKERGEEQKWMLSELPDGRVVAVISLKGNKIQHRRLVPHEDGKIIAAGEIWKDAERRVIINGASGGYLSIGPFITRAKDSPYRTASYSGLYVAKPILEKLLKMGILFDESWALDPPPGLGLQTSGEFEVLRPDELPSKPRGEHFLPVDQEKLLARGVAPEEVFRRQSEAIAGVAGRGLRVGGRATRVEGKRSLVASRSSLVTHRPSTVGASGLPDPLSLRAKRPPKYVAGPRLPTGGQAPLAESNPGASTGSPSATRASADRRPSTPLRARDDRQAVARAIEVARRSEGLSGVAAYLEALNDQRRLSLYSRATYESRVTSHGSRAGARHDALLSQVYMKLIRAGKGELVRELQRMKSELTPEQRILLTAAADMNDCGLLLAVAGAVVPKSSSHQVIESSSLNIGTAAAAVARPVVPVR